MPAGEREACRETPRKSGGTKERILDVAEAAVLEKGFAATSIEELIAAAVDITIVSACGQEFFHFAGATWGLVYLRGYSKARMSSARSQFGVPSMKPAWARLACCLASSNRPS